MTGRDGGLLEVPALSREMTKAIRVLRKENPIPLEHWTDWMTDHENFGGFRITVFGASQSHKELLAFLTV